MRKVFAFGFAVVVTAAVLLAVDWAKGDTGAPASAPGKQLILDLGNGASLKVIEIPAGKFLMGSPETEKDRRKDETQHEVTITKPFYMGVDLVSVDQFAVFVKESGYKTDAEKEGFSYGLEIKDGMIEYRKKDYRVDGCSWRNPSFQQAGDHPVVQMSWNDSKAFCDWLSKKSGKTVTLPTEAQWEYACRAGTTTAYPWGDNPDDGNGWANCADQTFKKKLNNAPANFTFFNWDDGYACTSPVESYKPNAFGLYDMIGEVWQWCADRYEPYTRAAATDPTGPRLGRNFVAHGGSWNDSPARCRIACRGKDIPAARGTMGGFRVVVSADDALNP